MTAIVLGDGTSMTLGCSCWDMRSAGLCFLLISNLSHWLKEQLCADSHQLGHIII